MASTSIGRSSPYAALACWLDRTTLCWKAGLNWSPHARTPAGMPGTTASSISPTGTGSRTTVPHPAEASRAMAIGRRWRRFKRTSKNGARVSRAAIASEPRMDMRGFCRTPEPVRAAIYRA